MGFWEGGHLELALGVFGSKRTEFFYPVTLDV
jgi:hypothetical protein